MNQQCLSYVGNHFVQKLVTIIQIKDSENRQSCVSVIPKMTGVVTNALDYGSDEYWELRYQKLLKTEGNLSKLDELKESASGSNEEILFDWYQTWSSLKDYLRPILNNIKQKRNRPLNILQVGCGNSTLGESIFMEGSTFFQDEL